MNLTGTASGAFATKDQGVAKAITVTGLASDNANYTITQPTGLTATVSPKALTVTGLAGVDRVYDGTLVAGVSGTPTLQGGATAGTVSAGQVYTGDTVNVTGTATGSFATKGQGAAKAITVTGLASDNANYTITQPTGLTATVSPKALTLLDLTFDASLSGASAGKTSVAVGDVATISSGSVPVGPKVAAYCSSRSAARSFWPTIASASISQAVQRWKPPSRPGRPSSYR